MFARQCSRCFQLLIPLAIAMPLGNPLALADTNRSTGPANEQVIQGLKSALNVGDLTIIQINDAPTTGIESEFSIVLNGQAVTINVYPHSVRADDFQVLVNDGNGGLMSIDPGPVRTIRGSVEELDGSFVTGSITDGGLDMRIQMPSGAAYGLTSARRYLPGASASLHALYDLESTTEPDGICGASSLFGAGPMAAGDEGPGNCEPEGPFQARIGCDTEAPFISSFVGTPAQQMAAAQQWIEDNVNEINAAVYELPPLSTEHLIARIVLRTPANDIYASTTDGSAVIGVLRTEWNTTQADADAELAALWLGRNLDGNVIGRGTIGAICTPSGCWVEKRFGNQRLNLLAHELGHNWGAWHCNQNNYPGDMCTVCMLPCPIMASSLGSCSGARFSPCSLDEILAARVNFTCIDDLSFIAPTVLDEGVPLSDGDTVALPEVLTGQTSSKILHIRNNQNCTLPIRVRLLNSTGGFTLVNPPTSIPPMGSASIRVEFITTYPDTHTAKLEFTTTSTMTGYRFGLNLKATAGVGSNLPGATALVCPLPWATTLQPNVTVFQWSPTEFVDTFQFQILTNTDQVLYNQTGLRSISHLPASLNVPVGQAYLWRVTAHNVNGSTPVASGFFVNPAAARPELGVSYRNIPIVNNATLNLPLNPDSAVFDFRLHNDGSVEMLIENVTVPAGFQARFVGIFTDGLVDGDEEGEPIMAIVKPCGSTILRLFRTFNPDEREGKGPVTGALEFDTSDPAASHFTINLCFQCDPESCVGDPFSGCGVVTHVTQGGCWHVVADCGMEFGIWNVGDFSIGDMIWVAGAVDLDAEFCFPQVQLPQIPDARVGTCVTTTGVLIPGPYCFAEPCFLRISTDDGAIYDVENTIGFQVGDRVTVSGGLQSYFNNFVISSQGLIFGNTIEEADEISVIEFGG